jgi:nicotinate-nucleotide adenylyltransferase
MRVALFGGSFDPPHRGHVALARLAIQQLRLDRALIAPVGLQPLKHQATTAGFEDRMAMVRLAFAGVPRVDISLADAPRQDGRPNYTVDAILRLKRTLSASDQLFCLMGADSWLTIGKWYRGSELLMACDFIVGARPGYDLKQAALPPGISLTNEQSDVAGVTLLTLSNSAGEHSRLYLLADLAEDVSATQVRAVLSHNTHGDLETVLDPGVAKYIRTNKLYGVGL